MTITVTKRGTHPDEITYAGKCGHCGTEVTYNRGDLQHCQRERDSWVRCPVCTQPIWHKATP